MADEDENTVVDAAVSEPEVATMPTPEPVVVPDPEPEAPAAPQTLADKAKAAARTALAAQPYRGAPAFEDVLAVADAIVDVLTSTE